MGQKARDDMMRMAGYDQGKLPSSIMRYAIVYVSTVVMLAMQSLVRSDHAVGGNTNRQVCSTSLCVHLAFGMDDSHHMYACCRWVLKVEWCLQVTTTCLS